MLLIGFETFDILIFQIKKYVDKKEGENLLKTTQVNFSEDIS